MRLISALTSLAYLIHASPLKVENTLALDTFNHPGSLTDALAPHSAHIIQSTAIDTAKLKAQLAESLIKDHKIEIIKPIQEDINLQQMPGYFPNNFEDKDQPDSTTFSSWWHSFSFWGSSKTPPASQEPIISSSKPDSLTVKDASIDGEQEVKDAPIDKSGQQERLEPSHPHASDIISQGLTKSVMDQSLLGEQTIDSPQSEFTDPLSVEDNLHTVKVENPVDSTIATEINPEQKKKQEFDLLNLIINNENIKDTLGENQIVASPSIGGQFEPETIASEAETTKQQSSSTWWSFLGSKRPTSSDSFESKEIPKSSKVSSEEKVLVPLQRTDSGYFSQNEKALKQHKEIKSEQSSAIKSFTFPKVLSDLIKDPSFKNAKFTKQFLDNAKMLLGEKNIGTDIKSILNRLNHVLFTEIIDHPKYKKQYDSVTKTLDLPFAEAKEKLVGQYIEMRAAKDMNTLVILAHKELAKLASQYISWKQRIDEQSQGTRETAKKILDKIEAEKSGIQIPAPAGEMSGNSRKLDLSDAETRRKILEAYRTERGYIVHEYAPVEAKKPQSVNDRTTEEKEQIVNSEKISKEEQLVENDRITKEMEQLAENERVAKEKEQLAENERLAKEKEQFAENDRITKEKQKNQELERRSELLGQNENVAGKQIPNLHESHHGIAGLSASLNSLDLEQEQHQDKIDQEKKLEEQKRAAGIVNWTPTSKEDTAKIDNLFDRKRRKRFAKIVASILGFVGLAGAISFGIEEAVTK